MPDVTVELTDAQQRELEGAASRAGMTVEQYAEAAMSHAISARYVLPSKQGSVIPIQGLNRNRP